jgi:hypothetical protein
MPVPAARRGEPVDDRCTRLPSEAEIAQINATHLIRTPIKPADLLFMFGTREDVARRADEAFRLWREGFFRWSIVSGGVTPGSSLSECEIIKTEMVARGIPPERILEEHRATNTGENVIFALPIIEAALGLKNIRSVICLGNTWTARRYAMTLHRHWPEAEKILITVDSFETPLSLGTPIRFCEGGFSANGTRSSPTWRKTLSRSGPRCERAFVAIPSNRNPLPSHSTFPTACAGRRRAARLWERPAPAVRRLAHARE